jgi:hypothetical protein
VQARVRGFELCRALGDATLQCRGEFGLSPARDPQPRHRDAKCVDDQAERGRDEDEEHQRHRV